jgi:hypothetical protein
VVTVRISKRTREQAALLCAIGASTPLESGFYYTIALDLGVDERAVVDLAFAARYKAWRNAGWHPASSARACASAWGLCRHDAEAEALLRCGWDP